MTAASPQPDAGTGQGQPRDAAHWAEYERGAALRVSDISAEAVNLNVEGKRLVGPLQGFGRLWQKTYRVRLEGVTVPPAEVVAMWKEHFTEFWPKGNRFYAPLTGLAPGRVAVLNLTMGG